MAVELAGICPQCKLIIPTTAAGDECPNCGCVEKLLPCPPEVLEAAKRLDYALPPGMEVIGAEYVKLPTIYALIEKMEEVMKGCREDKMKDKAVAYSILRMLLDQAMGQEDSGAFIAHLLAGAKVMAEMAAVKARERRRPFGFPFSSN